MKVRFTIHENDAGTEAYTDEYVDELKRKLAVMTKWLNDNQSNVFRRGIWDAIAPANADDSRRKPRKWH